MKHTEEELAARSDLLCGSYKKVEQYAMLCGVPKADREDIVQDVLTRAYASLDKLRDTEKMQAWLYRITKNRAACFFAQKGQRAEKEVAIDLWLSEPLDMRLREDVLAESPSAEILSEKISMLKPQAQKILYLRFNMGFTLKEVARILGMNYNTVKTTEKRALEQLRQMLEEEWHQYQKDR